MEESKPETLELLKDILETIKDKTRKNWDKPIPANLKPVGFAVYFFLDNGDTLEMYMGKGNWLRILKQVVNHVGSVLQ